MAIKTTTTSPTLAAMFAACDAANAESDRHEREVLKAPAFETASDEERKSLVVANNVLNDARVSTMYAVCSHPVTTPQDLQTKLAFMVEFEMGDGMDWLPTILEDVQRIKPATAAAADKAILEAFGARCAEFAANYHLTDMSKADEDVYFERIAAQEAVIYQTPADTIAGIVAKLRIDFMHRVGTSWSDHAIMNPTAPVFAEGLASDQFARQAWAAIEDLARIGGIDLSREGH
jgi:hypothetical protein